jgi:hypothetical protein
MISNGTASGDCELKTLGLDRWVCGSHQDLLAGGREDGNGGYNRE